ncbi:MAG TPA: class I SAM-dependent methyltransferase [Ktedonobacteraceae bacterium]|jgi:SAM-dependent methyltransferase
MATEIYVNGDYLSKNPLWHTDESPWKVQEILRMFQRNRLSPQTICEVGCGAGEILHLLQKTLDSNCEFQGYEISPQAFEMSKTKENERLHFHLADFTQEHDAFYDLILVMDVVEHVEDYFSFLRDIHSKSRYKIIQLPLDLSVRSVLLGEVGQFRQQYGHLHYFTKELALQMFDDLGYKVLDYFYTTEPMPQSLKNWENLPTLLKCKKLLGFVLRNILRFSRELSFRINEDMAERILGQWRLLVLVE